MNPLGVNFGDALSNIGAFLAGVGTICLAYGAFRAMGVYKLERRFQHQFEVAKEILQAFNHLREDIRLIRSPFGYEGESQEIQDLTIDNELVRKMKRYPSFGRTLLRMDKRSGSLPAVNRLEPQFRVLFGQIDSFQEMRTIWSEINSAAQMLCSEGLDREIRSKWEATIWSSSPDDELNTRMNSAIEKIETICSSILTMES